MQARARHSPAPWIACCLWLALLWVTLVLPVAAAGEDTPPADAAVPLLPVVSSNAHAHSRSDPLQLKAATQLVTNAPTAGPATTNTQKSLRLSAAWQGWEGLELQLQQRTPLSNPADLLGTFRVGSNALAMVHLNELKMTARLGARIAVDGAAFVTTGNLTGFDDGVELRRALFSAQGDCILILPVSYLIELGYIPNQFYLNQAYLLSPYVNYLGNVQFGVYGPPQGLDLITSSRDITFMEPAAPLQALGPPNMLGLQFGHPVFNQRGTWAFGFFGDTSSNGEYGNASSNFGSALGRLTWLALDHLDPEHPSANRLLHLGLSANYQYSASSSVRYRSRPESYIAPYIIDTGNIDGAQAATFGGEAAYVNGSFSVQGEIIQSFVQQHTAGMLHFGGFYGFASWFLTGESRRYDPTVGDFQRVIPRRNFKFGRNDGWGAVEVGVRFSHTDLTDGSVQGGRLDLLMAGVNWYLQPHVRWIFNYGMGRVSGGPNNGDMFIFQTRVGVDF